MGHRLSTQPTTSMPEIYVAPLDKDTTIRDIEDFFTDYGRPKDINFKEGTNVKYAFVEIDPRDVDHAVKHLDGLKILGQRVTVQVSKGKGSGPGYRGNNQSDEVHERNCRDAMRRREISERGERGF